MILIESSGTSRQSDLPRAGRENLIMARKIALSEKLQGMKRVESLKESVGG